MLSTGGIAVFIFQLNFVIFIFKVGEKLGKFEVEKRQAVENEDYDKAKLKKIQMEEYRVNQYQRLNVPQLLAIAEVR